MTGEDRNGFPESLLLKKTWDQNLELTGFSLPRSVPSMQNNKAEAC